MNAIPRRLFGILLICTLFSCSDIDRTFDTLSEEEVLLLGTWDLDQLITNASIDYNGDGEPVVDFMSEFSCFSSSIVFSENGSWISSADDLKFNTGINAQQENTTTYECVPNMTIKHGEWKLSENLLTTQSNDLNQNVEILINNEFLTITNVTPLMFRLEDLLAERHIDSDAFQSVTLIFEKR